MANLNKKSSVNVKANGSNQSTTGTGVVAKKISRLQEGKLLARTWMYFDFFQIQSVH